MGDRAYAVVAFNDLLGQVAPEHQLVVEASQVREASFEPKLDPAMQGSP